MALKFIVHGVEVIADDAAQAAKLIRELALKPIPTALAAPAINGKNVISRRVAKSKHTHKRPQRTTKSKRATFNVANAALGFINALKVHGRDGVTANDLMAPVQASHVKGVGSRIGMINKYLASVGVAPAALYSTARTRKGRYFYGDAKFIDSALEAIKNNVK